MSVTILPAVVTAPFGHGLRGIANLMSAFETVTAIADDSATKARVICSKTLGAKADALISSLDAPATEVTED